MRRHRASKVLTFEAMRRRFLASHPGDYTRDEVDGFVQTLAPGF
jgi:hypothetical protein